MIAEFSKQAYSATALQKAAYEVAAEMSILISETETNYVITAQPVQDEKTVDFSAFVRSANDYALREKLSAQTAPLRHLILAHAYSKTPFVQK